MDNEKPILPGFVADELIKLKKENNSLHELYSSGVDWLCCGTFYLKGIDLALANWFNANTKLFEYAFITGDYERELDTNER